MPAFSASAPGKIILFGEHAAVYGRPAIAAPVNQVKAKALVMAEPAFPKGGIFIQAPETGVAAWLPDLPAKHPLGLAVRLALEALAVTAAPAFTLRITSTIPRAAGLGSGAAVSIAILRAVSGFLGRPLDAERVNALAFEVEKIHHGTPSGIDNTVITYGQTVFFSKEGPIEPLKVAQPFTIVIGDTGITSPTAAVVGDVRLGWQAGPQRYEAIFDSIAQISWQARTIIEKGQPGQLGPLLSENHQRLKELGVSSNDLERLVETALTAGALGAKLSGAGRGGNMIALVRPEQAQAVAGELLNAGAVRTIVTEVR